MTASKRRFGYVVWGAAGLVIAVPEVTAAADPDALPFTTISAMVGHLEFLWNLAELIVIAVIVFPLFSLVKVSPPSAAAGAPASRTLGGRLTRPAAPPTAPPKAPPPPPPPGTPAAFDAEPVPWQFILAAVGACVVVIVGTLLAVELWGDDRHFHAAYVLYGSLALFWLLAPSVYAFVKRRDPPYPTLLRTVNNLEDELRRWGWRPWGISVGAGLAWLVSFIIVWGLVVLMLHITLYPFPDLTHIVNPNG
jgi:hypothetical protein